MAKAPQTKSLVGLVCLGLFVLIGWLGLFYMRELGRAFGNAPPSPDAITYVVGAVAVFSLVFASLALFQRGSLARVYALAPIGLVVLGEVLLMVIYSGAADERASERAARAAAIAAHVATLPQTYVAPPREYDPESFLFLDEQSGFLMRIDHDTSSVNVECLGSLLSGTLSLEEDFEPVPGEEDFLAGYVDGNGRSPVDVYEVVYVERLNRLLCDYERYELR